MNGTRTCADRKPRCIRGLSVKRMRGLEPPQSDRHTDLNRGDARPSGGPVCGATHNSAEIGASEPRRMGWGH